MEYTYILYEINHLTALSVVFHKRKGSYWGWRPSCRLFLGMWQTERKCFDEELAAVDGDVD